MRRFLRGTTPCMGEEIEYYLLTEFVQDGKEYYGIQIVYGDETEVIPVLSESCEQVEEFLRALARGKVTPVTARDVAEDWFC